jgi:hypothetical protein
MKMNKEKLWGIFLQQNPRLCTDPCLTPESLRRFFDLTWNAAYEAGAFDMADRQEEISGGDDEDAAKEAALQTVLEDAEKALAAIFGQPTQKKIYVKKANKKKAD